MALTKYTFSIATDTMNSKVDGGKLQRDILNDPVILIAPNYINTSGDVIDIWMKDVLPVDQETQLGVVLNLHDGVPLVAPPTEMIIQEEAIKTGGHFQARGIAVDIPAIVGWYDFPDLSWPFPVSVLSADAFAKSENNKDTIEFLVAPDTIVGAVIADVTTSDTILNVQQSVIDNMQLGYWVGLYDGINTDSCGRCLNIDSINSQITVETAPTNAYAAVSPTYVRMTNKMACEIELTEGHRMVLGESKIGGSYLPANTVMRLRYNNRDGVAKRFAFVLEYLY